MSIAKGDLVAVTGSTGGIGRRVVRDLVERGYRVQTLGRSAADVDGVEHRHFDLSSADPVEKGTLAGCSAVIHLAAHIPADQNDPAASRTCLETNALGTLRLLMAMESEGVWRMIQTTSANAYAVHLTTPAEEDAMYPSERASFYLSSKLVQDIFGSHWGQRPSMSVTTLRISSVYGTGLESALFSRFAKALISGEPVRLANGGTFAADFVDVADVSRAIILFLENGEGGPVNIASGERTDLVSVARLLLDIIGRSEELLQVEPTQRPEAGFPAMNIARAREMGFEPTPLREGLERLVYSLGSARGSSA